MNRQCPSCKKYAIKTEDLEKKEEAYCLYCNTRVEKWFSFSIFLSVIFGGGALLSFKFNLPLLGSFFLILSLLYSIFYKKINSRYVPLRPYDN